jgi:hypothetical protein
MGWRAIKGLFKGIDVLVGEADATTGLGECRAETETGCGPNGHFQNVAHFGLGAAAMLCRTDLDGAMRFLGYVSDCYGGHDSTSCITDRNDGSMEILPSYFKINVEEGL